MRCIPSPRSLTPLSNAFWRAVHSRNPAIYDGYRRSVDQLYSRAISLVSSGVLLVGLNLLVVNGFLNEAAVRSDWQVVIEDMLEGTPVVQDGTWVGMLRRREIMCWLQLHSDQSQSTL